MYAFCQTTLTISPFLYPQSTFRSPPFYANMLFKTLAVLALAVGAAADSTTPTSSPTAAVTAPDSFLDSMFEACPSPLKLQCDTDPSTWIPQKFTQTIQNPDIVVTASITCEGTASADVCIVADEEGGVGIIVADESTSAEICNTMFMFEEGVRRYKSLCRGNVNGNFFRIKEELKIQRIPVRHLKGLKGLKGGK
jgi:hypothetical protein